MTENGSLTEGSRRLYGQWLDRWERFCAERALDWRRAKAADLESFRQALLWAESNHRRLYSPNTVDLALRTLRRFYRWALLHRLVRTDPTVQWVLPRPAQPERTTLNRTELAKLLNQPDVATPHGQRDQLIFELLYNLRLSTRQCVALQLHHVEANTLQLADFTWDLEPVSKSLARYLADGRRRLTANRPVQALLVANNGQPLRAVQPIVYRYARKLGLPITARALHHSAREHADELHRRFRTE